MSKKNTSPIDRIRLAAEWLDRNAPGWFGAIDADIIDIRYFRTCILGQMTRARWVVKEPHESIASVELAFLHPKDEYESVNAAWTSEVRQRQANTLRQHSDST